jgi:phosphoenolpyruvate carboxykinase (GTP)
LFEINAESWRTEASSIREGYARFGDHLPFELRDELDELEKRLA